MSNPKEYFNANDNLHREDGPAFTSYYRDGSLKDEAYYIDGKVHREDGPAGIRYNEDGYVESEIYCIMDKLHRDDGPALIRYNQDGEVTKERWFKHGKEYIPSQEQVDAYRNKSKAASTSGASASMSG